MVTALGRGWHLFSHGPRAVLADWLAWPLVGIEADTLMAGMLGGVWRCECFARHLGRRPLEVFLGLARSLKSGSMRDPWWGLVLLAWRQSGGARVFELNDTVLIEAARGG